jgi:hypothetical protein
MTSYTPNIPQPGDDPSDSQDQILQNFQTLNSLYGTSGDHYAWTNTTPVEISKHAKVTFPGLPTVNAPGNAIPAPIAGNCALFSQTRNSQTTPFLTRDGLVPVAPLTNIWPLMPIKAYAIFTLVAGPYPANIAPVDSFNITNPIVETNPSTNVTVLTFTMVNACRTTNYGIYYNINRTGNLRDNALYSRTNNQTFVLTLQGSAGVIVGTEISIFIMES